MAPGSSPSCGGVRIKLLAALAAGVFFGFGVCDLFMRLTAAPVPPLRLTAATTAITTTTSTTVTHPRRQKAASSLRQPPPRPSAARGVVAQSSSLPSSLPRPARHGRAPSLWSASPCPANCSSHGVCNLDVGECVCELGYAGDDCSERDEFPCNIPEGDELVSRCAGRCEPTPTPEHGPIPSPNPPLTRPLTRPLTHALSLSRCAGRCDETELKCYCGGGKFPRRPMFQCEFKDIRRSMPWKVTLALVPSRACCGFGFGLGSGLP